MAAPSLPANNARVPKGAALSLLIYGIFGLSGVAALMYQVLWVRQLTRILGYTTTSVAVVLTAFMAGLALGSMIAGKWATRTSRPLRSYAFIEIGLACYAILFPLILGAADHALLALVTPESPWAFSMGARVVLAIGVLIVPTTLMGMTLPYLSEFFHVLAQQTREWRVGMLYATNTLGAALGTILTTFLLIELLGESSSVLVAALLNVLVALASLRIDRPIARDAETSPSREPRRPKHAVLALSVLTASGAIALAAEVLWTRLLGIEVGNSAYAFGVILVVYLTGIAAGSGLMSAFVARLDRPALWLVATQALTAVWTIIALEIYDGFFSAFARNIGADIVPTLSHQLSVAALILLPLALFSGAAFPLATRLLEPTAASARGSRVAEAYALNTVGAMFGAFAAGFFIAPYFDLFEALYLIAGVGGAVSVVAAINVALGDSDLRLKGFGAAVVGLVSVVVGFNAATASESRSVRRMNQPGDGWQVTYNRPGRQGVTTVLKFRDRENASMLLVNGRGMTIKATVTKLMAHLPMLLHPDPQDTLVICFGMGTTYRSAISHGARATVVELVDEVLDAFPNFYPDWERVRAYPRGRMVADDGRNFLKLTRERFDVITIDPPPPIDAAGVNNLYSREFIELARDRLKPGGILAHWLPMPEAAAGVRDPAALAMLLRTIVEVFPHTYVLPSLNFPGLHVLGSDREIVVSTATLTARASAPAIAADLHEWEQVPIEYLADLQPARREFPPDIEVISDDRPLLEFHLFQRLRGGRSD